MTSPDSPDPRRVLKLVPEVPKQFDEHVASRALASLLLSVLVDLLVWTASSKQLPVRIDIVGYPSFYNYDIYTLFMRYRLETYAFPAGVIAFYALLCWRGPLRLQPPGGAKAPAPLLAPEAAQVGVFDEGVVGGHDAARSRWLPFLWRPLAPAFAVVLIVSVAGRQVGPAIDWVSEAYGCAYFTTVTALAGLVVLATGRGDRNRSVLFSDALSVVNAAAEAAVAFGGLWFVSRHTEALLADGSVHRWSWLPWWLAGLGVVVAWLWIVVQLRRGQPAPLTEQRLRVVVIGSIVIYLLIARIPPGLGYFQGFDDSQGLTGAFLVQHGYFPWRDFQFIHGFFVDVLEPLVGFHVFGETAWGSDAGLALIFVPLSWVSLYLLVVWGARRGSLVILAPLLLAASDTMTIDSRFMVLPLIWVLLGKAIASRRLRWTRALTLALFIEAVVIPEADFQAVAAFIVLVAAELVHRVPADPLRIALRRTLSFVRTGAVLMVVWLGFLASQHALAGFVDWFTIFVQGHVVEGGIPPGGTGFLRFMFEFMVVLVVLTVISAGWRFHRRRPWTPVAWVTLAVAINAGLYGEQAIARFDSGHIQLSVDVALPLFALVAASVLPALDRFAITGWTRLRAASFPNVGPVQPVTAAAVLVVILLVPAVKASVQELPSLTRTTIGPQARVARLGYAAAGLLPTDELSDWRSLLDTYTPNNAPFFDMTNSPGYFYFLLARRPASVFTNVSLAIPEAAQSMLISDLRRTRPPLVAFSSTSIGLDTWDGIQNEVRHFEVSQYVLDGWTPLVEIHDVLFLLRNDLVSHRPRLPHLRMAPQTTNLYNSQPECQWGESSNFLQSEAAGRSVTIHPVSVSRLAGVASTLIEFRLPRNSSLSSYALATFASTRPIGRSYLTLSSTASAPRMAEIAAGVLPVTGSRLAVRVGSCLQWHGFRGRTLYVTQRHGAPITSLTLSQVRG